MKIIRRMGLLLLIGAMVFLTIREIHKEKITPLAMDEVRTEMLSAGSVGELKEASPKQLLRELGKSDAELFATMPADLEGVYWYADYLMDAREVFVIKSEDEQWLTRCSEALKAYAGDLAELFATYEPVQSSYLSAALVEVKQGVLYYFVGPDATTQRDMIEKLLKKARG